MTHQEREAHARLIRELQALRLENRALKRPVCELLDAAQELALCLEHGRPLREAAVRDLAWAAERYREVLAEAEEPAP